MITFKELDTYLVNDMINQFVGKKCYISKERGTIETEYSIICQERDSLYQSDDKQVYDGFNLLSTDDEGAVYSNAYFWPPLQNSGLFKIYAISSTFIFTQSMADVLLSDIQLFLDMITRTYPLETGIYEIHYEIHY